MTFFIGRKGAADARPDYAAWASREVWSVSEGAKLICGRDPHGKIPGTQAYNKEKRVIDIIDEAFAASKEGAIKIVRDALLPIHVLVEPASFLKWAKAQGLAMPDEFSALTAQVAQAEDSAESILLKERVVAIARTLWTIYPTLTTAEIAAHEAMRRQLPTSGMSPVSLSTWLTEAKTL
jgi:hypothetical protein